MKHIKKAIFWSPRILSIGFIIFLSLFSLDVFNKYSGIEALLALFIHLAPSILLFVVTIIAWRHALVGTIVFVGFGGFYLWEVGFSRPISWYISISLPAVIVGLLYLLSWIQTKNLWRKNESS